jgi:hypothetical protein
VEYCQIVGRDSNVRLSSKNASYALVAKYYQLAELGKPVKTGPEPAEKFSALLNKLSYTFPSTVRHFSIFLTTHQTFQTQSTSTVRKNEPYGHTGIIAILSLWFKPGSLLLRYQDRLAHDKDGNYCIPKPLLAFVGTLVCYSTPKQTQLT